MPHLNEIVENNEVAFIQGQQTQAFLEQAADFNADRMNGYKLFDEYYDGKHGTQLTDRLREFLQDHTKMQFNDNFCETVIDTVVNRMRVNGFTSDNELFDTWAESVFWPMNKLDDLQRTVHHETSNKGDGFIICGWDAKGFPRTMFNRAQTIQPTYDPDDSEVMLYAVKKWTTNNLGFMTSEGMAVFNPDGKTIERMNIYFDDRVEKYFRESENGPWGAWIDAGDTTWPLPLLDKNNQPLGIPVFHFRNKPRADLFGRSELSSILPLQDLMNKTMVDLALLLDNYAMPQRWATGIVEDVDSQGNDLKNAAGEIWASAGEDVKFGQFPAEDAAGILRSIEMTTQHLAARTQTPLHLLIFSGDTPSGESLKTAEAGLTHKIKDRQTSYGNVWEAVVQYAAKLQNTFGTEIPVVDTLQSDWEDPESRNEKEWLDSKLVKNQLGVSQATILSEMGYDPQQEMEQSTVEREAKAAMMQKAFEQDV